MISESSNNYSQSSQKLFRSEVFAARQDAWLGELLLSKPLPFAWLSAGLALLAVSLMAFFVWGE